MERESPITQNDRGITRRDLEAVIRRAAELYASEADAEERISEAELFRIAAELGLPSRHVRQALIELPTGAEASLLDQLCGSAVVAAARIVPGDAERTAARLEEYLTSHEYLQLQRRQPGRSWYAPAEDAISKIARNFSRPKARCHVARARRTLVAVQPVDADASGIRVEIDLTNHRKTAVGGATSLCGGLGALIGAGLAFAAGSAAGDLAGTAAAVSAATLTFGGATATGIAAGIAVARAGFRRRVAAARTELEGLLDRLERGGPLEPPPAPWRRRLRARLAPRPHFR
ncbi:MAG TPA: hypothetical protein VF188_14975 [Longimicrobiales bacterium]